MDLGGYFYRDPGCGVELIEKLIIRPKKGRSDMTTKAQLVCPLTKSPCALDECAWYLANDLVQGCAVQHIVYFLAGIQANIQK